MRWFRPFLLVVVTLALGTYAFDCEGMAAANHTMDCCAGMPCPSHGHGGRDCCRNMPAAHAPFVLPAATHRISLISAFASVLPALPAPSDPGFGARSLHARDHAPPALLSLSPQPLRI